MIFPPFWYIFWLLLLPIYLKQFLVWLYVWQLKEYRGDKMWDYLSLPESKKVVYDKWTVVRFFYMGVFLISGIFSTFYWDSFLTDVFIIFTYLFLACLSIEVLEFFLKILLGKKILVPKITSKSALHLVLNLASAVAVFMVLMSSNSSLNLFLSLTLIVLIPVFMGYWLLAMFPLDYYLKISLFEKAKSHRLKLKNLKVIAVSGAYGKTTTKELLFQLLSHNFSTEKTLKNQNTTVSCARKTLSLTDKTELFICELGSYRRGDGNETSDFIRPTISIITGLNLQHYSLFGSKENILLAESESTNFLPDQGMCFLNWSSPMCRELTLNKNIKYIKYGVLTLPEEAGQYDYYAKNLKLNPELYTEFELVTPSQIVKLSTNLLSQGNLENLVGSLAVSLEMGLKIEELKKYLTNLSQPYGSLQIEKTDFGFQIDDSYNANFDGVKNAINLVFQLRNIQKSKAESLIFLDDILELGDRSYEIHQNVAKILSSYPPNYLVLLGRNFSNVIYKTLSELNQNGPSTKIEFKFWNGKNKAEIKDYVEKLKRRKTKLIILHEGFQSKKFL